MATFKRPKAFQPELRVAAASSKKDEFASELGFESGSDGESGASGDERRASDAESAESSSEDEGQGGISFIEHLSLQKSLRRVTEQKTEVVEQLKVCAYACAFASG